MPRPTLIVVTGPPGAGKTTLAHALARAIRCPLISRDEIKEGLVNAGVNDDGLTLRAFETFFATIRLLLERGVTVVAEAAFQHAKWAPELEALADVADVRIVVCEIDAEEARRRRDERSERDLDRARYHPDPAPSGYEPPRLAVPMLTVRTHDGYDPDFDAVVVFAGGPTPAGSVWETL